MFCTCASADLTVTYVNFPLSHNLWKIYAVRKILYGLEEKRNGADGNNAKEAT
jgi:hypothetical protein